VILTFQELNSNDPVLQLLVDVHVNCYGVNKGNQEAEDQDP
jgi:hypothetical protein